MHQISFAATHYPVWDKGARATLEDGPVLRRYSRSPPRSQVEAVDHDAEQIGRDKAQLRGLDGNDADNGAVDAGQNPSLPTPAANQNSGYYGKNAG